MAPTQSGVRPAKLGSQGSRRNKAVAQLVDAVRAVEAVPGGVEGLEGSVVRLCTVDDVDVARALSAHLGTSRLLTLVVRDGKARKAAESAIRSGLGGSATVPDMLLLSCATAWGSRGASTTLPDR